MQVLYLNAVLGAMHKLAKPLVHAVKAGMDVVRVEMLIRFANYIVVVPVAVKQDVVLPNVG